MKRLAIACLTLMALCGCPAEMWIPLDTASRAARPLQEVQYLEALPEKPFTIVGIITPPEGEYETEAEMIKAMRIAAATHGADAIFVESRTETIGWHFSGNAYGVSGGSGGDVVVYRAKAIVWN